tara:strand:- start:4661 stop:4870 length:210 start_codon:yes stop_codon:yes gene_type:complete
MGKVKNWMMDMEDYVVDAIESGASSENDVVAYVNTHMSTDGLICSNEYVKQTYATFMGEEIDESWRAPV